uniref:Uncharacterized protein n=1 Tax=Arundo donax TaxID=35708 RepID=A0A0A8Y0W2_ARUDO
MAILYFSAEWRSKCMCGNPWIKRITYCVLRVNCTGRHVYHSLDNIMKSLLYYMQIKVVNMYKTQT